MAVYAAHLTRTLHGTPSIFQITAQEALGATVKPALRKIVEYLNDVYPERFKYLLEWYDEVYLLLDLCVQYHYLKNYAASFSESFYGLMRSPVMGAEGLGGSRLPPTLERGSLLMLALLPYLKDKMEARIAAWDDQPTKRLYTWLSQAHGVWWATWCVWKALQLGRYACGRADSPTPALWALGLRLAPAPPPTQPPTVKDLIGELREGRLPTAEACALVLRGAQYVAFALQLLRWWDARGAPAAALPSPPPPAPAPALGGQTPFKNRCPVCRMPWRVPTVLPVSGYVFCYTCVATAIRAEGRCPATRRPARLDSLVRLYLP